MAADGRHGLPFGARYRRLLVAVILGTAAIVAAVHGLIGYTVTIAIEREAQREARNWAEVFNDRMPRLNGLASGFPVASDQQNVISAITTLGDVFRFKLFDRTGTLAVVSDGPRFRAEGGPTFNGTALAVIRSGRPVVTLEDGRAQANRPDVYVEAYVPAIDPITGATIGAIEVYLDRTAQHAFFSRTFHILGFGLPVLCAVLYLVPTLSLLVSAERRRARELQVARLSRLDPLTGVLNRASIQRATEAAFEEAQGTGRRIGLLFVDVDRFKSVNDEHGHEFGDGFLRFVADGIQRHLPRGAMIGRLGGDEFVVVEPDATAGSIDRIAEKILCSARDRFVADGRSTAGSLSVGRHLADPGQGVAAALQAADLALYEAKAQGRDCVVPYHDGLNQQQERRRLIEAALRDSWAAGRMALHFQPIVGSADETIDGFEALLRLTDEAGAPISPVEFIPVAEQTGLIHDLGIETIRRALETAAAWPAERFVSVNLSPEQFRRPDLVDRIAAVLSETGFPPGRLELEVTESILLNDEERVSQQLVRLKALGLSIAMDDFGTGYSSLGYLFKYSFDKLKIDRVFLEGYSFDSPKHREIIETIILLGHKMGMKVVAEGVETTDQFQMLAELNCDQLQGFLFGRPSPEAEIGVMAAVGTVPPRAAGAGSTAA